VEDHADHALGTFKTQREAIDWAKKQAHSPLVARVRHLNDKKKPDHWPSAKARFCRDASGHCRHGPQRLVDAHEIVGTSTPIRDQSADGALVEAGSRISS
jgi:hypothetical protein